MQCNHIDGDTMGACHWQESMQPDSFAASGNLSFIQLLHQGILTVKDAPLHACMPH